MDDDDNYEAEEFESEESIALHDATPVDSLLPEQVQNPPLPVSSSGSAADDATGGDVSDIDATSNAPPAQAVTLTTTTTMTTTICTDDADAVAATPLQGVPSLAIDISKNDVWPSLHGNAPPRILDMRPKFLESRALSYPPRRHSMENAQLFLSRLPSVSESATLSNDAEDDASPTNRRTNQQTLASMAKDAVEQATEATNRMRHHSSPHVPPQELLEQSVAAPAEAAAAAEEEEEEEETSDENQEEIHANAAEKNRSNATGSAFPDYEQEAEETKHDHAEETNSQQQDPLASVTSPGVASGTQQTIEPPQEQESTVQEPPSPNEYISNDFEAEHDAPQELPSTSKVEPALDHHAKGNEAAGAGSLYSENEFEDMSPKDNDSPGTTDEASLLPVAYSDADFTDLPVHNESRASASHLYADTEFEDLHELTSNNTVVDAPKPNKEFDSHNRSQDQMETNAPALVPSWDSDTTPPARIDDDTLLLPSEEGYKEINIATDTEPDAAGPVDATGFEETSNLPVAAANDDDQRQQEHDQTVLNVPEAPSPEVSITITSEPKQNDDEDEYADDDFVGAKEEEEHAVEPAPVSMSTQPTVVQHEETLPESTEQQPRRESDVDIFAGLDSLLEEAKWLITKQHQEEQVESAGGKVDADADEYADAAFEQEPTTPPTDASNNQRAEQEQEKKPNSAKEEDVRNPETPPSWQEPSSRALHASTEPVASNSLKVVDNQSVETASDESEDTTKATDALLKTVDHKPHPKPKPSGLWRPKPTDQVMSTGGTSKPRRPKVPATVMKAPKEDATIGPTTTAKKAAPVKVNPKVNKPAKPILPIASAARAPTPSATTTTISAPSSADSATTTSRSSLVPKAPPLGVTPKLPSSHQSHRKMVPTNSCSGSQEDTSLRPISSPSKPNSPGLPDEPNALSVAALMAKKTLVFRQKMRKSTEEQLALLRKQKKLAIRPVKSPKRFRFDTVDKNKRDWLYLNMFRHQERDIDRFQPFFDQLPKVVSSSYTPTPNDFTCTTSTTVTSSSQEKPSWVTPKAHDSALPAYDSILDKYCTTVTSPLIQRQIYRTRQDDLTPQLAYILEKRVIKQWRSSDVDPFGAVSSSYRTPIVHNVTSTNDPGSPKSFKPSH